MEALMHMDEPHLQALGFKMGPRILILKFAKQWRVDSSSSPLFLNASGNSPESGLAPHIIIESSEESSDTCTPQKNKKSSSRIAIVTPSPESAASLTFCSPAPAKSIVTPPLESAASLTFCSPAPAKSIALVSASPSSKSATPFSPPSPTYSIASTSLLPTSAAPLNPPANSTASAPPPQTSLAPFNSCSSQPSPTNPTASAFSSPTSAAPLHSFLHPQPDDTVHFNRFGFTLRGVIIKHVGRQIRIRTEDGNELWGAVKDLIIEDKATFSIPFPEIVASSNSDDYDHFSENYWFYTANKFFCSVIAFRNPGDVIPSEDLWWKRTQTGCDVLPTIFELDEDACPLASTSAAPFLNPPANPPPANTLEWVKNGATEWGYTFYGGTVPQLDDTICDVSFLQSGGKWFRPQGASNTGIGGRACARIAPSHIMLVPRCPSRGHPMVLSDGSAEGGYRTFVCNICGELAESKRWWCALCSDDVCGHCFCETPCHFDVLPTILETDEVGCLPLGLAADQNSHKKDFCQKCRFCGEPEMSVVPDAMISSPAFNDPVPCPEGWIPVEDITFAQLLLDFHGDRCKLKGKCPRGRDPLPDSYHNQSCPSILCECDYCEDGLSEFLGDYFHFDDDQDDDDEYNRLLFDLIPCIRDGLRRRLPVLPPPPLRRKKHRRHYRRGPIPQAASVLSDPDAVPDSFNSCFASDDDDFSDDGHFGFIDFHGNETWPLDVSHFRPPPLLGDDTLDHQLLGRPPDGITSTELPGSSPLTSSTLQPPIGAPVPCGVGAGQARSTKIPVLDTVAPHQTLFKQQTPFGSSPIAKSSPNSADPGPLHVEDCPRLIFPSDEQYLEWHLKSLTDIQTEASKPNLNKREKS